MEANTTPPFEKKRNSHLSPDRRRSFHRDEYENVKVRINCEIQGKPAEIFLNLKKRGLVTSARDAVVQGLTSLYERVLQRELQEAKLKASRRLGKEEF